VRKTPLSPTQQTNVGFDILNQHLKRHFVSKIPLVFNLHLLRRTTIKKYNKLNIERNKIMTLVRFTGNPLIDRFFDSDLFDWTSRNYSKTNTTLPSVNVKETDHEYSIELAAPGFDKSDFKIEVHNEVLTISSEKQAENETEEARYTKREFSYQSFCRSFSLPETADGDKVEAAYDKGILTVSIPKKEEAKPKAPRAIEIK